MDAIEKNPLRLTRAGVTMAVWGLVLLGVGIYNQYQFPSVEAILFLWGVATVVGFVVQAMCELKHVAVNFYFWLAAAAIGWAFTLFVTKLDNGAHGALYPDLPGIWLILLGVAYIDTARKIGNRFVWFGVGHIAVGVLLELSAHGILKIDFLNSYATLIFGIVSGGTLLVASVMSRVPAVSPQKGSALPSQSTAAG